MSPIDIYIVIISETTFNIKCIQRLPMNTPSSIAQNVMEYHIVSAAAMNSRAAPHLALTQKVVSFAKR